MMAKRIKPTTYAIKKALTSAQIPDHLQESALRELQSHYYPPATVKVKALRDGKITGFCATFTDATKADKYGTYFDSETIWGGLGKHGYATLPLYWQHGRDNYRDEIGICTGIKKTSQGLMVTHAKLALDTVVGRRCWKAAQAGKLYFSLRSFTDLVALRGDGGYDLFTPSEISLTDDPAGAKHETDYQTRSVAIKSANDNYNYQARKTLVENGLKPDVVDFICNLLPNPYNY